MREHHNPSAPVAEPNLSTNPLASRCRAPALRLKSIRVPTDFSDESGRALHRAVVLAKVLGAQIILLNVCKPLGYPGAPNLVLPMDLG
jgi:hypothetical protein